MHTERGALLTNNAAIRSKSKENPMAVRITCINKQAGYHQDPHHAIEYLGWVNEETGESGKSARVLMYDWLKNKGGVAYVFDKFGNKAFLYARENAAGTRFVQTYADNVWTDNLLSLPECR
jgi:hypothetical protein